MRRPYRCHHAFLDAGHQHVKVRLHLVDNLVNHGPHGPAIIDWPAHEPILIAGEHSTASYDAKPIGMPPPLSCSPDAMRYLGRVGRGHQTPPLHRDSSRNRQLLAPFERRFLRLQHRSAAALRYRISQPKARYTRKASLARPGTGNPPRETHMRSNRSKGHFGHPSCAERRHQGRQAVAVARAGIATIQPDGLGILGSGGIRQGRPGEFPATALEQATRRRRHPSTPDLWRGADDPGGR